jgi:catechol 2,3-dioxygenase-like lactoylglutathione lyase family enzyme
MALKRSAVRSRYPPPLWTLSSSFFTPCGYLIGTTVAVAINGVVVMINLKDSNVTLMVQDMDASIRFYESIGLTLKNRWGNHYAMVSGGGVTLGIHPGGNGQGSGQVSIGFVVDDIDQAEAELGAVNVACRKDIDNQSGTYLHFVDPDGTILYLIKPKW